MNRTCPTRLSTKLEHVNAAPAQPKIERVWTSYIPVRGPKSTNGDEPTGSSHPVFYLPERIFFF